MKNHNCIILFVILLIVVAFCAPNFISPKIISSASEIKIDASGKEIVIEEKDFIKNKNQVKSNLLKYATEGEALKKIVSLGFDEKTAVRYIFDNVEYLMEQIAGEVESAPVDSEIIVNGDSIYATSSYAGKVFDKEIFLEDLYYYFTKSTSAPSAICLKIKEVMPDVTMEENQEYTFKKASFSSHIAGINQEGRIHNIKTALSKFNGKKIEQGEVVSFNSVIGMTTEENGYKKAKVIINGKYEDDFGGGVCQAATTLYNALLIAGLEVIEVNPHSLKVGYVAGSFDAMVSNGLSDLVFKNNTSGSIYISTWCTSEDCGVYIFGEENEYEIKRHTENVEFDAEKLPKVNLKTAGYLEYIQNGETVKKQKIRQDTYYKLKSQD